MSTRPLIPSQAESQSVRQRVSVVISPPPPPPPSSQPEIRESMKRKRSSVWDHFERSVEAGIKYGKCNYCDGGKYRDGGKKYGTTNLNWHLTRCEKYLEKIIYLRNKGKDVGKRDDNNLH
ncbi:hypothetical protein MKX03_037099 [Papaver bracteatum]|nr:hypothetical protein MKX03_037099 [Papaver bracteatum]